jgi:hypothetical protein
VFDWNHTPSYVPEGKLVMLKNPSAQVLTGILENPLKIVEIWVLGPVITEAAEVLLYLSRAMIIFCPPELPPFTQN